MRLQVVDLSGIAVGVEGMLRRLIGEDVELAIELEAGLPAVSADPGQIEQVILNLAVNARDAMPRGGRLTISTRSWTLGAPGAQVESLVPPGTYAVLSVEDTGSGMDAETLARIFEPFFTTKKVGEGTGLGLSTVYGIVKQSGGHVTVDSRVDRGTRFHVYLPALPQSSESSPESRAREEAHHGTGTVLLVEDEEVVRSLAGRVLRRHGYTVLEAGGGEEALRRAREHDAPIDLLLTDVVMPRMSGQALAERLRAERPDLRVIFMSGYTEEAIVRHGVLAQDSVFVEKPFTPERLARMVREALDPALARGM